MPPKPHIRLAGSGLWECDYGEFARAGRTFKDAYDRWLIAALMDAQERVRPSDPGCNTTTKASRSRKIKVQHVAPGVRVHRIEEQVAAAPSAKGEGKIPSKVKRMPSAKYIGAVAPARVGEPRPPYQVPSALSRAGVRAAQTQPRLISITAGKAAPVSGADGYAPGSGSPTTTDF